jgi:hypothetical protein
VKHVSPGWGWHIPCCYWRRPEFIQQDIHGGHVRRFEMSGLKQGALFILVLSILAVACGGTDPATSSADEKSQNNDPSCNPDPSGKVTICHIPPGNPANAHTIDVGAPAVRAHLAHGDYCGPCHGSDGGAPEPNPSGDAGMPGGGPPGPNPDGGPGPNCLAAGAACGTGLPACCSGLACSAAGQCGPALN